MSDTTDDDATATQVDDAEVANAPTTAELGQQQGLPTANVLCRYEQIVRQVQVIPDAPSSDPNAQVPVTCLTCGGEFGVDRAAVGL